MAPVFGNELPTEPPDYRTVPQFDPFWIIGDMMLDAHFLTPEFQSRELHIYLGILVSGCRGFQQIQLIM